ncbi:HK97 family phage prohead protease [Sulfitobacter sp. EhC04]|uniref:HK97 family phage prohead protease n=1 Tax=Sulfitobacter sp. EhC04 TaxID=1849168 RepID=UPI0009EE7E4F|nr:HK97 family phage prohead protease [Sulfitobacter sp. EhC04]
MNNLLELKDGLFKGDLGGALQIDTKAVSENGEFEGYASHFNVVDQGDDMMMAGAFKESLSQIPAEKVRMLYHHDPREVIGKYTEIREDATGLFVKGRLFLSVQRGKEVHELMKERAIEGLSIGYRTKRYEIDRDNGVRRLLAVDLREISVVTFPMEAMAGITLVKHDGSLPTEREFERYLTRDAGFTAQQAKAIIADGYKSLNKAARDAGQGSDDAGFSQLLQQATALLRA